ncbi:MAG: glucose-1-phosphate cytidylyltransferase [Alphaproteobacteria bacterium]|nr:glucose-1-phosphate cytidylyltransferase [Alphaproteobacteria bacterium]
MKVLILAGGYGTRISEESQFKPKPMVEIGGKPVLWHIMKYYSSFGFNDFVVLGGYKQYVIKEFFADYFLYNADVSFNLGTNEMKVLNGRSEKWSVAIIDTGLDTMTGGRVKRVQEYVGNEPFMLTYGDGVSDVDLNALWNFHKSHGKVATVTMVSLAQQKGVIDCAADGTIRSFREKNKDDGAVINGGFMVFNSEIFNYLRDDSTVLEQEPMQKLANEGQLMGYFHKGFWQCMDTQREKKKLEEMWVTGNAPWKR